MFGDNITPVQELLVWHYGLGHLPWTCIQFLAKQGVLPRQLATVIIKSKRTQHCRRFKTLTILGACVLVGDQMELSMPGARSGMTREAKTNDQLLVFLPLSFEIPLIRSEI